MTRVAWVWWFASLVVGCNPAPPPPVEPPPVARPAPPAKPAKPAECAGASYHPVAAVDHYFAIGLDVRDVRAAMAKGDWAGATALYANGKNQVRPDGSVRSIASFAPLAEVHFPGARIDPMVRDAFRGVGRAHGNSDAVRIATVEKGMQWLTYGKVMEELDNTTKAIAEHNLDGAEGAPKTVDEAFAAIVGAPDPNGVHSYSLFATAASDEESLGLQGQVCAPLEAVLNVAHAAALKGDAAAYEKLHAEILGRVNAIFYLAVLRAGPLLESDTTEEARQAHLEEAWASWQVLKAAVSAASPAAAQSIEAGTARSGRDVYPASETAKIVAALREPAVRQALAIPASLP